MSMHHNSRAAHDATVRERAERERLVLAAFDSLGAASDREVARHLGFTDLNAVRPRITEMVERGALLEVAGRKCAITGRTVRICRRALA